VNFPLLYIGYFSLQSIWLLGVHLASKRFVDFAYNLKFVANGVFVSQASMALHLRLQARALLAARQVALRAGVASRAASGGHPYGHQSPEEWPVKLDIGKREVVGFGNCGEENYFDDVHYPFPAIRFKEDKGEIVVSQGPV